MSTQTPGWTHGKALRIYSGQGVLIGPSGEVGCRFELVQEVTGRLLARCEAEGHQPFGWSGARVALRGRTDTAHQVALEGGLVSSEQFRCTEDGEIVAWRIVCRTATVSAGEGYGITLRYGLTNLDLPGNEGYEEKHPGGAIRMGRQSRLRLDGCEVVIRPLPDAREILDEIRATRGIAVTCLASVAIGDNPPDVTDQMMTRLCLLLGLGQGHGVAWVYREALDANGGIVEAFHGNAITKPCGGLELVPGASMEPFVEGAYRGFQEAEERWGISRAILAFTDSKIATDYLELRALKVAVVMEHVRACYLRGTAGEFIMPEPEFDDRFQELKERLKPTLDHLFAGHSAEQIEGLLGNLKGLNRPAFARTLRTLCEELGVPIGGKERRLFVEIRNSLVHRAALLEKPEPWQQYCFLATVIGRILLAILGWQGDYRDWTKDPNQPERLVLNRAQ